MAIPNKSVNRAFQKGLQLIYKKLFQYIYLRFLDTENTQIDSLYKETKKKVYKPPIRLLGHYVRERQADLNPNRRTYEKESFKIPVQELYDHKIGFKTKSELAILRQAVIQFEGMTYKIDEINPRSVIAGDFLIVSITASPVGAEYKEDIFDKDLDLREVWQEI